MHEDITFRVGRHRCAGRLVLPPKGKTNGAAIVLAAGLSGTMDCGLTEIAADFAAAGFVALAFDYRNFGASGGTGRQYLSVPMQLADWRAAIAFVRARDDVGAARVGLWGVSFSGVHVVRLAVDDPQIAAITAAAPMLDFHMTQALNRQWQKPDTMEMLTRLALRDWAGHFVRRPPLMIPVVAETSGETAILGAPEAAGFPDLAGESWRNEIAARSFVSGRLARNDASRLSDDFDTPILIQLCDRDQSVSNEGTENFARRVGSCAETKHYDCGHFGIFDAPFAEQMTADARAFFTTQLF